MNDLTNDNTSFTDLIANPERDFAERSLSNTIEGLKARGVPYETITRTLFDFAIAEATGSDKFVDQETKTFFYFLETFRDRCTGLIEELDEAVTGRGAEDHDNASR
jgi:hypothetical protein